VHWQGVKVTGDMSQLQAFHEFFSIIKMRDMLFRWYCQIHQGLAAVDTRLIKIKKPPH
jgi:hypothetical protein